MQTMTRFAIPSLVLAVASGIGAYFCSGFCQSALLSTAEVLAGLGLALVVVNGFLNQDERKRAAVVLLRMVHEDVVEYHRLFIQKGRDKFGIPVWNGIIDSMNENQRKPEALAPEQRQQVTEMIDENSESLLVTTKSIDERFREVSYVLGWNFHPSVTRDCMQTRLEIDKFRTLLSSEDLDEEQCLKKIELYFDIDANASAVLDRLARICGIKPTVVS
ncbi:MAG: hypothetical protein IH899_06505 [Planctomycetes bacterium]|nr:hypothetical protein [Planctomycetota bacterium]